MSRTDKTRPYWVKVNDHGVEHHDHSQLGQEVWRSRPMKDKNGKVIHEGAPVYVKAKEYILYRQALRSHTLGFSTQIRHYDEDGYRIFSWRIENSMVSRKPQRVWDEATQAVSENQWEKRIVLGTYLRPKTESYLAYTIADHCTIGEKNHGGGGRYGPNPCYMEANWNGVDRKQFSCGCDMCSWNGDYARDRRSIRDTLKAAVKATNSGDEDWEDEFDSYDFTPNRRGGRSRW